MRRLRPCRRSGMTLIELLLAVGLMAVVSAVAFFCYNGAVRAWRAGQELTESLHQGDYIMEQLVMGLRSAYMKSGSRDYGFVLTDDGSGADARDTISWVKLGTALIGSDAPYASMPHKVEISVRDVDDGHHATHAGLAVRSWRLDLQKEDFDADKVEPVILSTRVQGFNCRVLDPQQPVPEAEGLKPDLKWSDEWLNTNKLPRAVEITLFVQPPEKDRPPVEMKRVVQLPMASD